MTDALDFLPGMVIVCVTPCRSMTTGETAVMGEELILPLSALGERSPLTRTSQLPPPWTSVIQAFPVYLRNQKMHVVNECNPATNSVADQKTSQQYHSQSTTVMTVKDLARLPLHRRYT